MRWRHQGERVCEAPFASMYLDQHGDARACCVNEQVVLGNIATATLAELWQSPPAQRLRRAVDRGDLRQGCEFCAGAIEAGGRDTAFAAGFDGLGGRWLANVQLRQLELSITNVCNLRCVMCNGEWSSSIRAQREHRPPLADPYPERFYSELAALVPELEWIKLLGGEPLLARPTLRVLEVIADGGTRRPRVHVTTNGTRLGDRTLELLDRCEADVSVSVDAATAERYESIRVGASWAELQDHLARFEERAARTGTWLGLTFCLMVPNWDELGPFLLAAEQRELPVYVNKVTQPDHLSLTKLDAEQLAPIVAGLDAWERAEGHRLGRLRPIWDAEVERLRWTLEQRRRGEQIVGIDSHRRSRRLVDPWAAGRA